MPIDADDLRALLPDLDDAPGPELADSGSADGLRFTGLELTGDARDAIVALATCASLGSSPVGLARLGSDTSSGWAPPRACEAALIASVGGAPFITGC